MWKSKRHQKYLQACNFCRAWSMLVTSSRTRSVPLHCSDQVLESWQGLQRRLQCWTCRPRSRRQTSACWAPWDPEEVGAGTSWETECCPLEPRKEQRLVCIMSFLRGVYFWGSWCEHSWSRLEHASLPAGGPSPGSRHQGTVS